LGGAHPELVRRAAAGEVAPGAGARALVPGCGRGHDALFLGQLGYRVTALDLVEQLAPDLGPRLAAAGGEFLVGDALAWSGPPVELFFEHTFFCALDPALRGRWGELARRALLPGGWLLGVAFPADKPAAAGGPPHRTTAADLAAALGPAFVLEVDEAVHSPVARREWAERWFRFRRLP
jgi:SAM-dependent methyltransferase